MFYFLLSSLHAFNFFYSCNSALARSSSTNSGHLNRSWEWTSLLVLFLWGKAFNLLSLTMMLVVSFLTVLIAIHSLWKFPSIPHLLRAFIMNGFGSCQMFWLHLLRYSCMLVFYSINMYYINTFSDVKPTLSSLV